MGSVYKMAEGGDEVCDDYWLEGLSQEEREKREQWMV